MVLPRLGAACTMVGQAGSGIDQILLLHTSLLSGSAAALHSASSKRQAEARLASVLLALAHASPHRSCAHQGGRDAVLVAQSAPCGYAFKTALGQTLAVAAPLWRISLQALPQGSATRSHRRHGSNRYRCGLPHHLWPPPQRRHQTPQAVRARGSACRSATPTQRSYPVVRDSDRWPEK